MEIWGRLKEPQKLALYNGNSPDDQSTDITKASIRKKVWEFMERNDIANFPRPVYHRIPNFKGASAAGDKVTSLPEFHEAKNIKVNPDKPQEEVRFRTLESGKTLYVPTPRLTQGLFNRLEPEPDCTKESLRKMSSRYGIDNLSKPVPMASRLKIDLVVIGSVAVDRFGRRIGKGEGFADLEWSMAASHHSAVTSETVVITTVHDVQVFDELPQSLFYSHDLPVDIIVTPTEVIRVSNRLPKPDHLQWDIITREKFDQIGILKELQFREKKAGTCVKLSDGYEDVGPPEQQNNIVPDSNGSEINGFSHGLNGSEQSNKRMEGKYPKRKYQRRPAERQSTNNQRSRQGRDDVTNGDHVAIDKSESKRQERTKNKRGQNNRNQESIGIFVGRIPRTARVKELKDAIQERGLRTNNLVWKGVKGFAFLYFDKSHTTLTEEEICIQLKDLKLGETVLNIEPDKRKDRNKNEEGSGTNETGEQDGSTHNIQKGEKVKSEKKDRRFNNPRPKKNDKNPTNPPPDTNNETLTTDEVNEFASKESTVGNLVNGLPTVNNVSENLSLNIETNSTQDSKETDVPLSSEKMESIGKTDVKELEVKIEQLDIVETTEIKQDTKDVNVKSKDTAGKKQETINKATKHCEVEVVASENKSEKMDSPPKIGFPLTKSAVELSTTADSKISSQTNSADMTINKTNNQGNEVTSEVKSKVNIKEESTEADLKSSQPNKEIIKQVSDTHLTNKTVDTSLKNIETIKENPKIGDTELTLKNESKSSKDGVKVIPNVSSKTAVKPAEASAKVEQTTTSKSDATVSKKEKSKTPDKEVKKEEGSGGGFFKRFWK